MSGQAEIVYRLGQENISYEDAQALRRISMTLHRWAELECGDGNNYASWGIERDEATNVPYMVTYPHNGESYRRKVADKEAGALKRLAKIMAAYPELTSYHQTDPRGAALYIVRKDRVSGELASCYTNGIAVY